MMESLPGDRLCLDVDGEPLCQFADQTVTCALLVESLLHVTCEVCIAISNVPASRLQPRASA